ncbi:anthranilate phosphoribosyltransferase [Selenomonas sp. WCA-380-WT-3B 3/]|uniref:Anthranilate phosphoribosyltransferase n=1 Tax=Selenomonas montiformis TaxID=2652285 RepID=A0A6I2UXM4_9FIRM|nr:anthranilate phosphoribosyltransferase [Selenomonas montiformis]MSV24036.1 anthranilate phosphoribosyltransferase [Selenomonas montiformis]
MIKEAIEKIVSKQDLTYREAYTVMDEIMSGETSQVQNAAYLAALSTKSTKAETIDEISGSAAAMRDHALKVNHQLDVLDIVGTGGDHAHSINISTTAAMIIAAAGVRVAKHGNRAASSKCGAADCLEALGVSLDQPPEKAVRELQDIGLCFLFAQKYHASMKYVGAIRKELGIRTVFNILGPLTNPAHPTRMMLGVYDEYLLEPLAKVMLSLGVKNGMVIYGQDCLDEFSLSAPTSVCEFREGWFRRYTVKPEDFGFARCTKEDIRGGLPEENARITLDILHGAAGPKTDIVLLNAGAAIYVGGQADSIASGIEKARQVIASGAAMKKLDEFRSASHS